jgi:hypothetical protein
MIKNAIVRRRYCARKLGFGRVTRHPENGLDLDGARVAPEIRRSESAVDVSEKHGEAVAANFLSKNPSLGPYM